MSVIKLQGEKEKAKGIYYEVDPTNCLIGVGGMGRVYKGTCINSFSKEFRPVAIKFLYEDSTENAVNRARREASIQLRNDNLIEMFGFIETIDRTNDGTFVNHYHVVSELLHGVTLSDILEGRDVDYNGNHVHFATEMIHLHNTDPERFAMIIMKSVLSGLTALHDNGYIHRDIDPSNIMLTDDEHVKLIDFGIAKRMGTLDSKQDSLVDPCQKERLVGKMKYAAPELVKSDVSHQDRTTDIYALGILFYQLLCNHLPFEGNIKDVMEMQLNSEIPLDNISNPIFRSIIKKATEKQQENRYQSASEFRVALDNCPTESISVSVGYEKSITNLLTIGAFALAGLIVGFVIAFIL